MDKVVYMIMSEVDGKVSSYQSASLKEAKIVYQGAINAAICGNAAEWLVVLSADGEPVLSAEQKSLYSVEVPSE